jgi:NarL family two-component system response regulator LiaR
MQWKFLIVDNAIDIYIGLVALFFTTLGIWVAKQVIKPKVETVIVEKEIVVNQSTEFILDDAALEKLKLNGREYEILQQCRNCYKDIPYFKYRKNARFQSLLQNGR